MPFGPLLQSPGAEDVNKSTVFDFNSVPGASFKILLANLSNLSCHDMRAQTQVLQKAKAREGGGGAQKASCTKAAILKDLRPD